ncbi:sortase [Candidatus Kaiserbacteria bacterium]|nr:sortase [Candidatus Kaiserbacteria bacterium]
MNNFFEQAWRKKWVFFSTFFFVFTLTYIALMALDFLPEAPVTDTDADNVVAQEVKAKDDEVVSEADNNNSPTNEAEEETEYPEEVIAVPTVEDINNIETGVVSHSIPAQVAVLPTSISISKLGKTVQVLNPSSRTIADLDTALLDGVVRHPDSATLDQEGNVFILGHSSYLPRVFNKNFQAFNGIQDLVWGDIITVSSADAVYEYRVEKVYKAKAQDATVPIAGTGHMLTLATCNSFGSVDDRYIVEAKLVE